MIAAINGMVVGGGLHFVVDSDIVVCSEEASFLDTHVKVGLIAGLEPVGLARKIPLEAVMRLALLGGSERMSAQEAHRLGLVGEVVSSAEPKAPRSASIWRATCPAAAISTRIPRSLWPT